MITLTTVPTRTKRPANRPLFAEWQSAWMTKWLVKLKGGKSRCVPESVEDCRRNLRLRWLDSPLPMFCHMMNKTPTAIKLSIYLPRFVAQTTDSCAYLWECCTQCWTGINTATFWVPARILGRTPHMDRKRMWWLTWYSGSQRRDCCDALKCKNVMRKCTLYQYSSQWINAPV